MHKAIIGIATKNRRPSEEAKRSNTYIRNEVKQAIFDNGAIAIGIVSPNQKVQIANDNWKKYENSINKADVINQLKLCDGIILQGGDTNEAFEPFIAKYCYDHNIPCLGICAGQNSIIRGLGGTTYKIPNPEKHYQPSWEYVHTIQIDKTSKFYDIVRTERMLVNSRHKRAVDQCPLLQKVGFCDDGYADVIEAKDKKFYIGLRFHPESLYQIDENMNNIFRYFIASCIQE